METVRKEFLEKAFGGVLPAAGDRQKWLTMATESPDRAGDVMVLAGMDAENFRKNPQFIWQHGNSGAEINTIGKILDLQVSNGALLALAEFATAEVSPLAEEVYQMCMAGLLPANSIGFRPIEYEKNDSGGFTFTKWELIECSKVELPMNPEAIDKGLKRKTSIELDEAAMLEKAGAEYSSKNKTALREHAKQVREHAKALIEKADALDKMLDAAEKEEPPFDKSVATVSTRRLRNRAILKSKRYKHD